MTLWITMREYRTYFQDLVKVGESSEGTCYKHNCRWIEDVLDSE